jgi:superfamily II DNA/RNA helicase
VYEQIATIPLLLDGKNIAMQSHTGSGKTLAYLLPVLARILLDGEKPVEERDNNVQCLVVVPSQELAMQIVRQMERVLGDFGKNITQQCIGGANVRRQEDAIRKKKPLVVVGTPGRLAELSRTGILQTHGVRCLVVDEADDLLASNFRRDMARICDHTGKGVLGGRQTVIVSATLRPETMDQYSYMAPNLMHVVAGQAAAALAHEQRRLSGGGEDGNEGRNGVSEDTGGGGVMNASLPPNLEHYSVVVGDRHKVDRLRKAIHATGAERALIFLNFGHRLAETRDKLATRGMDCGVLHGGLDKHERTSELAKFRRGDFRALLVSDLAARGIDVPEVDAVFNLELPTDETHYVHRAGRTGRMGAPGLVMSFAAPSEAFVLSRIGKKLGINIHAADLQNGQVVPDRGNTPTPRKVHELENEARESRSGRGGRGGARSGRGGEREGDERDRGRAISAGRGGGGGRGGGSTSAARRDVGGGYNGRYDEYDHYIDNAYDRPERGRGEDAYGRPARGRGDNAYDRPARGRGDDAYDRPARGRGDGGGRGGGGGGSAGSGKPIHYTPKGQPRRRRKNAGGA